MIELIRNTAIEHVDSIIIYAFTITLIAIIAIINRLKRDTKYRMWKRDSINIFGFKREWEATADTLLQELWDENQRLEAEVQVWSKKYKNLSTRTFIFALIVLIVAYIQLKFTRKKHYLLIDNIF